MTFQEAESNIGRTVMIRYKTRRGTIDERVGVIMKADFEKIEIEPLEIPDILKIPSCERNQAERLRLLQVVEESKIIVRIEDIQSIENLI